MKREFMDFSRETCFQEELLRRIKDECFAELSDDDLSLVNAAGAPEASGLVGALMVEEHNADLSGGV